MTISSLFKTKKKNSKQNSKKKMKEDGLTTFSQKSNLLLENQSLENLFNTAEVETNEADASSSSEDIFTLPPEPTPEVKKHAKTNSRWKKPKEVQKPPSPIFFQSIMRSTREPQFGPLYNVVKSMIHPSELKGIPVEKCRAPMQSNQWYSSLTDPTPKETSPHFPMITSSDSSPPYTCPSTSSSIIDFSEIKFDRIVRTPEPPRLPKIFGFDRYGNEIEEENLPDIIYGFGNVKDDVYNVRQLEKHVDNLEKLNALEEQRNFAEANLPINHDSVPKKQRETAEQYMKSICATKTIDDENDEPRKVYQNEIRIRRKIAFGSYPNNSVNEEEMPRILRYTWKGKLMKLKKYLKDKFNRQKINKRDQQGRSALHFAASWGCEKTVKILLDVNGISLNITDDDGKTPLYKAVEVADFKTVKLLVDAGAAIDRPALDGRNPFEYALQELGDKHFDLIMYMYLEGKMHKLRKEDAKMTYLHLLCLAKNSVKVTETMQEMIRCREFVNATEGQGRTPLILAAQMNRSEVVKVLLDNSADVKHVDMNMKAAIQYVKANTECYKLLRTALNRLPRPKPKKMKNKKRDSKRQARDSLHRIRAKSPY